MHPVLLAIHQDRNLTESARLLASALYARTNGTLRAAVELDGLLDELGVGEGALRRRRAELAQRGWLVSRLADGVLAFELQEVGAGEQGSGDDGERAVGARERAVGARLDGAERAVGARQRALGARFGAENAHLVRAAERESRCTPPNPPYRNSLNKQEEVNISSSLEGGAGGDRSAHLLRALGVAPKVEAELAGRLSFEAVARHVAAWQIEAADRQLGVGALVERMRTWPVPPGMDEDDLTDGVLAEFVTAADLRAWGVRRRPDPLAAYQVPEGYEGLVKS